MRAASSVGPAFITANTSVRPRNVRDCRVRRTKAAAPAKSLPVGNSSMPALGVPTSVPAKLSTFARISAGSIPRSSNCCRPSERVNRSRSRCRSAFACRSPGTFRVLIIPLRTGAAWKPCRAIRSRPDELRDYACRESCLCVFLFLSRVSKLRNNEGKHHRAVCPASSAVVRFHRPAD